MGIILGWLCLVVFIGLLGKAVTRKLGLKKCNAFLMKAHKPLSVVFLVLCVVHIIFVLKVFQTRAFSIYVTGVGILLIALILIILCHVITKNKKQQFRLHRILSFGMLLLTVGHMVFYQNDFTKYKENIAEIVIEEQNTSEIPDGVYLGECNAGYIYVKVKVSVEKGKISDIKLLEHRNERGKAAEEILADILDQQSLQVDTVSGATNSSKVIKKAVENALKERKEYE